jgi:hypothetical protein
MCPAAGCVTERLPVRFGAGGENATVGTIAVTDRVPREPAAARATQAAATSAATRVVADGASAPLQRAAAPRDDELGRALRHAVAQRTSVGAAPAIARVRKKKTSASRGGTPYRAGKRSGSSRGVKKPRKPAPSPAPAAAAAAVAVITGRPQRRRRAPGEIDRQIHWGDPDFGPWTALGGGTSVDADLGPAAGQAVNYGSVPRPGECTAVDWLNMNFFGSHLWIKGHLLNDNLGGEGVSENMTPMTHTANMRYKAFESSIKNAIDWCYRHGQFHHQGTWYGVRVAIVVNGQQWPLGPTLAAQAVAQQVTTTAQYISKTGDDDPVAIAPPDGAPGVVTGNFACVA